MPQDRRATIIETPNKLLQKLGGAAAVSQFLTPDTVRRLDMAIASQAGQFVYIIDEYVGALQSIVQTKKNIDENVVGELKKCAHELRGIAGTFGFSATTTIAKSLWNFLDSADPATRQVSNIVDVHVEALLATKSMKGDPDPAAQVIIKGLEIASAKFATR
jgi:chemotaxis protein histidine kinase CheA